MMLRLPRRRMITISPRSLPFSSSATASLDVSAVVDVLVRPPGPDNDHLNSNALHSLLSSAPYTASHLLQILRSLPTVHTARLFFQWCRTSQHPSGASLHSPSAYQVLFELASREGTPDSLLHIKDILDESTRCGLSPTFEAATLLVRVFGRAGMLPDALRVFHSLKPSLRKTRLCNELLQLLFRSGGEDFVQDAVSVARDMIRGEPRCRPDAVTGTIVFSGLGKKGVAVNAGAAELLVELAEFGVSPHSTGQLTQLISKVCRDGLQSRAWDILHAVKEAGAIETAPCNALLTGLSSCRDFDRMNMLFLEMKEWGVHPDVVTFGILINHLCKSRRVDEAVKMLDGMLVTATGSNEAVVSPDVVLFNTIIDGLCKEGRMEDGLYLLNRMKAKHGCLPNAITYNCLIDGFCKGDKIDLMFQLLEQMKNEGIKPNVVTLNTLVDGFCRNGRVSSALEFFHEQKFAVANVSTYNSLMGAFLHANNVSTAMELFDEMLRGGHKPDAITYFTLISGLGQAGRLDDAMSIASQMQKDGYQLDLRCYNILINGFCKQKKLDKASKMLDEMAKMGIQPNEVTFNTLISTSSKLGDFVTANLLLNKMTYNNYKPNVVTYGALIHGYCKAGKVEDALKVLSTMIDSGIPSNDVIYGILIECFSKQNKVTEVLSLLDEMQTQNVLPSTCIYNSVFRCLRDRNMLDEACEIMESMKQYGCNPDYITMEILTEWFSAVGEIVKLKNCIHGKHVVK